MNKAEELFNELTHESEFWDGDSISIDANILKHYLEIAVEYKQDITIEELREQLEAYQRQFYPDSYFQMIGGKYADEKIEELWDSYKQCAIDCGILKE